jgi:hypothetical protein
VTNTGRGSYSRAGSALEGALAGLGGGAGEPLRVRIREEFGRKTGRRPGVPGLKGRDARATKKLRSEVPN